MKRDETLFRTKVEIPGWGTPMEVADHSLFLGSCFAQEIGGRFQDYGLASFSNMLGVLYNPESIASQILQSLGQEGTEPPVFRAAEGWRSWWAGTCLQSSTREGCVSMVRQALDRQGRELKRADWLFLTLGSNVCYALRQTGETVANCHRQPQSMFEEKSLGVAECVDVLSRALESLHGLNPSCRMVFTVSPYRYAKYTYHGSRIAKATLLLAVEELCRSYPAYVGYFPAYEIVLDELRDYRFYDTDMLHPSQQAVDYVWLCLQQAAMSVTMRQYLEEYEPIRRGLAHRPANPDAGEYKAFMCKLEERRKLIRRKYKLEC
ncbi:GSCFA domain-containing protein [bacterium]|nr:GSCFA domain-containing protein [bacterium]